MDPSEQKIRRRMRLDPRLPAGELIEIELVDGVKISAINDISDLTTWVLFEQEDWFEPEVSWLRRVMLPGWKVLDLAPAGGVLAASLAARVGHTGQVVAIEPDHALRHRLQKTRAANRLNHLYLCEQAPSGVSFDIIRTGADGATVLRGHPEMLSHGNPIVIVRLDAADPRASSDAAEMLRAHGYDLYHFLAAFKIAIPLDVCFVDDFTSNLIACRGGPAADLATRGLLLRHSDLKAESVTLEGKDVGAQPDPWPQQLARIKACLGSGMPRTRRILESERLVVQWLGGIRDFVDLIDHPSRLIALIRLLASCGARTAALEAMRPLLHRLERGDLRIDEPTVAISDRFDHLLEGNAPHARESSGSSSLPCDANNFLTEISIVDLMCRMMAHSSFVAGSALLPILNSYRNSPNFPPELERRRQLMSIRASQCVHLESTPPLLQSMNQHLFK